MDDVSVSIFCQNEAPRIGACIAAIATAGAGLHLHVTIIINGSSDDSAQAALDALRNHHQQGQVYAIPYGDKANAINQSFYALRRSASLYAFVDAYSLISPASLSGFVAALAKYPDAVAATGVARNGRTMRAATAETLDQGGRLHGQLHAFRPDFLDRLTSRCQRLPVGLYRGDGLLGSMACHNLDAPKQDWVGHRIRGVGEATYDIPQLSPFRPADIRRQFRRKIRQMRGRLENEAIKSIIYSQGYQALPAHADDMIATYLRDHGPPATSLPDRPFMRLALHHHAHAARPTASDLQPVLIGRTGDASDE